MAKIYDDFVNLPYQNYRISFNISKDNASNNKHKYEHLLRSICAARVPPECRLSAASVPPQCRLSAIGYLVYDRLSALIFPFFGILPTKVRKSKITYFGQG